MGSLFAVDCQIIFNFLAHVDLGCLGIATAWGEQSVLPNSTEKGNFPLCFTYVFVSSWVISFVSPRKWMTESWLLKYKNQKKKGIKWNNSASFLNYEFSHQWMNQSSVCYHSGVSGLNFCLCVQGSLRWCWRSNPSYPSAKQVPCLLSYLVPKHLLIVMMFLFVLNILPVIIYTK